MTKTTQKTRKGLPKLPAKAPRMFQSLQPVLEATPAPEDQDRNGDGSGSRE